MASQPSQLIGADYSLMSFYRKLFLPRIWERIFRERLSEPLHLNLMSVLVGIFGNFEARVYFDLVLRQHNAFCLLEAARLAKFSGYKAITAVEFGVASGAGIMNMCEIAPKVTKATGIAIEIFGFDSGSGMPPPLDYRDHPNLYAQGDFPMQDFDLLSSRLPTSCRLIIGNITETVLPFLGTLRPECPIGYVVIDVDYYSSANECLKVFRGPANLYLPESLVFLDDVLYPQHNPWQGEYLAVNEFNSQGKFRKVCQYNCLRSHRLLKNASWIDQVYLMHVLDHEQIQNPSTRDRRILSNVYLENADGLKTSPAPVRSKTT